MRLFADDFFFKVFGILRFLLLRYYYYSKLQVKGIGLVGAGCDFRIYKNATINLGRKVILSNHVQVKSKGMLTIGNFCTINEYSRIIAHEKITIGDNVTIAKFVTILDHDHNFKFTGGTLQLKGYVTSPVAIGNNVWIADKCTILKGVTIGDNIVIGAHTLVNKDVPSNCVIGGSPYRIIRTFGD